MGGSEVEVIGAYNAFIDEQKKLNKDSEVNIRTTLVLFDDRYDLVYESVPAELTPNLTSETYFVRGMTSLNDAIGKTIAAFESKEKVIFFIETDGFENSSREYDSGTVRAMVKRKTDAGWDFNFVGADLTATQTKTISTDLGITKSMAFMKSADGYATRNATFSSATQAYVNSSE